MTKEGFSAFAGILRAKFGHELHPGTTMGWVAALEHFEDELILEVITTLVAASDFYPTPAEVVALVRRARGELNLSPAVEVAQGELGRRKLDRGPLTADGAPGPAEGPQGSQESDRIAPQVPQDGPERFVGRPLPPKPDLEAQKAINAAGLAHVRKCLAEVPSQKRRGTMFADEVLSQEFFSDVAFSEDEPFEVESYL